jgi:hypothetical protein
VNVPLDGRKAWSCEAVNLGLTAVLVAFSRNPPGEEGVGEDDVDDEVEVEESGVGDGEGSEVDEVEESGDGEVEESGLGSELPLDSTTLVIVAERVSNELSTCNG